ncbi:neurogenic locus notch homolog protein 3-like isoform X2 [Mya arenaria]|uniref:neurogenic locus notch homolog protein 3-like isoform X2 n=1 Tax=Mya arenaria TaxID=6604 RepID=UPI0022E3507B|nr:neurogenic locus notch homolog protein 3-like isoform X2 [Mya arenaria]
MIISILEGGKRTSFSACPPGHCSLDETSLLQNENCDIEADTECDINVNCNGDGKCFFDQYTKNITCICSEKRIGDTCQNNYTAIETPCSSTLDCHGGVCIEAVPGDNTTNYCDCPLGFKGSRCEHIDRKFLSESWECENEAKAYIQGQYFGCSCKCGTVGQFCEKMDERALYQNNCDNRLCKRGKCVRFISGWRISYGCKCPNSFTGTFCQYPNTKEILPQKQSRSQCPSMRNNRMCRNGGSCFVNNENGWHTCECPCGFHGDFCQFRDNITNDNYIDPCVKNANYGKDLYSLGASETVGITLAVVVIVAFLIIVVWYMNDRRKHKEGSAQNVHTRQNFEQFNTHFSLNASQNSIPAVGFIGPPSYEEVCQQPPTYFDALRSMPY